MPVSPQLGERKKSEEPGSFEVNNDKGIKRRLRCRPTTTWRRVMHNDGGGRRSAENVVPRGLFLHIVVEVRFTEFVSHMDT